MRAARFVLLFYILFAATVFADEKQWRELDEATLVAAAEGRLDEARQIAEKALAVARKEFGKNDLRTATSLALLAEVLMGLENWKEAEARLREASEIRERMLKPGHPDLEQNLNLMARLLTAQGRFEEAEPLYFRALAAAEKAANAGEVGPTAPRWTDVIATLDLLATFHEARGDGSKASEMRSRAVDALARYASSDKEDHLQRLEELAQSAMKHRAYDDAERVAREQVRLAERYFGTKGLATALGALGAMFEEHAEYARALPLYRRLLSLQEKELGATHLDVAASLHKVGLLHRKQKEYEAAQTPLERALAIREKALGTAHAGVAATVHELGLLHESQSDYTRAIPFFERSLAIRERALSAEDLLLATTLHDLAFAYFIEGEPGKAEPLYKRSLAIREKVLGPDDVSVGWSLNNLAWLYADLEQYAKAEPLYLRALAIMEKTYGANDATVGRTAKRIGELYRKMGRNAQAEPFEQKARAILEK